MATKKIIDILPPDKKKKPEAKINKFVSSTSSPKINKFVSSALPSKINNLKPAVAVKKEQVVVRVKKTVEPPPVKQAQAERKFQIPAGLKNFKFSLPVAFLAKKAIFALPMVMILGVFLISAKFSSATVEIWPRTEKKSFEAKLILDKKVKEYNALVNAIPADIVEKEKTVSSTFPASGKSAKETKAAGIITVYNNYSASYQVLVANTRFVSTEGKIFRTTERIMIPGTTDDGGKMKAGEINIRVVADQPGAEYNIGPDTFSIPGFAGTDRYTKFYAKSFQSFTGGSSESVAEVTAADLNKAEDIITRQAKEEAENLLKSELKAENVSSVFSFLENNIQAEVLEKSPSAQAGAAANEFTFQAKAKAKAIVFKKEDINSFVRNYIADKIPAGKKVYEPSLKIDYSAESINFETGSAQAVLKISIDVYFDIDEKALKNNISQKSLSEIKLFLASQPEISNVLVKMRPFWAGKAPKDINRITLKITFDQAK